MDTPIFLKQAECGKLLRVQELSEADFVRIPSDEYVPVDEWNTLIERHMMLKKQFNEMWQNNPVPEGEYYKIPIAEYHGLKNCLRILKDRSLQEIERAKADKHGYTLQVAEKRVYERAYPDYKAFYVTKATPISLKIDLETASFLIKQDLMAYYNYTDISAIRTRSYPTPTKIRPLELLKAIGQRDDPGYTYEYYLDNSEKGRKIKQFLDHAPKSIIFDIIRIGSNYGAGIYTVTYCSTGLI